MRTIVVGVDGSPDSRRAVEWAADLAAETGARVVAVHAVGLLEHESGDPTGAHLAPDLDRWTAGLDVLGAERVERRLVAGDPWARSLRRQGMRAPTSSWSDPGVPARTPGRPWAAPASISPRQATSCS